MNMLLGRLFQHVTWADQEVMSALESASQPNPEASKRLSHLLVAEHVWLCRIQGKGPNVNTVWPVMSASECRQLSSQTIAGYQSLLATITGDHLMDEVSYTNMKGEGFQTPLGDILLHVALHGAYHRGQIASNMRQTGIDPVNTDFITFSRLGSPCKDGWHQSSC